MGEGPYLRVYFRVGKLIFGLLRYTKSAPGHKSVHRRDLKASGYNCYIRIDSKSFKSYPSTGAAMRILKIVILKILYKSQYSKITTLSKVNMSISDEYTETFSAHFPGYVCNADFVIKSPSGVLSKTRSEKFRKTLRKTPAMEPSPATLLKKSDHRECFL